MKVMDKDFVGIESSKKQSNRSCNHMISSSNTTNVRIEEGGKKKMGSEGIRDTRKN